MGKFRKCSCKERVFLITIDFMPFSTFARDAALSAFRYIYSILKTEIQLELFHNVRIEVRTPDEVALTETTGRVAN